MSRGTSSNEDMSGSTLELLMRSSRSMNGNLSCCDTLAGDGAANASEVMRCYSKHRRRTCLIQNGALFLLGRHNIDATCNKAQRIALAPLARKGLCSRHACSHSSNGCKQCISARFSACKINTCISQATVLGPSLSCSSARIPRTMQQSLLESSQWDHRQQNHCCDYSTHLCRLPAARGNALRNKERL
jgi:hypothetical protein